MTAFRFQHPWVLLLLVPIVIGAILLRRRQQPAVLYSSVELLRELPRTFGQRLKQTLPWLRFLALALVVVALARPQLGEEEFRVNTEGIAIEMCIDRSGSMLAMDFSTDVARQTRLDAVKQAFREFVVGGNKVSGRPNDLIGLVAFGGFADAICPHTLDHGTLLELLDSVEVAQPLLDRLGNISPELDELIQRERLTAIGDAVTLVVDRLRGLDTETKIVILLSDGENTAGIITPEEAADVAQELGIKIYTIGIGRTGSAPFEVVGRDGRTRLQQAEVVMDEKTLRMLADKTNGKYFHAQNRDALARVYEEIDALEKTEIEGLVFSHYRERCQVALFPAVLLLLIQAILDATLFRSLP